METIFKDIHLELTIRLKTSFEVELMETLNSPNMTIVRIETLKTSFEVELMETSQQRIRY